MTYPAYAQKIIALRDADLSLREQLLQQGQLGPGYHPAMEALHAANARELAEIMEAIGLPTTPKVGAEASEAAWLIVQHAIGVPAFMRRYADLLETAVQEGIANPRSLAYLTDRIAVFSGQPQQYGTQFDWDEQGQLSPQPHDDAERVNARRAALGMNTLAEQTALIRQRALTEGQQPPADWQERQRNYDAWRRRVGWVDA